MDEQLKEHSRSIDRKIEEQSKAMAKRFEESDRKSEKLMKMMRDLSIQRATAENPSRTETPCIEIPNQGGNNSIRNLGDTPKIVFPKFDGSSSRNWIKKRVKYFSLCKIPEEFGFRIT